MQITLETERKLLLVDPTAWRRLASCLRSVVVLHQTNHFLDDAGSAWRRAAIAVRVRVVDDCAWLTLKGPAHHAGGFLTRAESEAELTLLQRSTLLEGGPAATAWLTGWMRRQSLTIPAAVGAPLQVVASFGNIRGLGWWVAQDGVAWEIALDRSTYPDGTVVDELELELHGADPQAALGALDQLIEHSGVEAQPSTVSKRHRLATALGEPDDESRP